MPYIDKDTRSLFDNKIDMLLNTLCDDDKFNPGELNYIIYRLLRGIVKRKGIRYELLNALAGVLECCGIEFQRRVVAPYEDKKIKENGDVE